MNTNRNNNFNFLRVLFATLVILSHSPELIDGNRNREMLTQIFHTISFGEFAVDGFFILSGYLIVQSWHLNPNPFRFLKNRVLRIYPGFIAASILCVFLVGPAGANDTYQYITSIDMWIFFKNLIFLRGPQTPVVFIGWPYTVLNGAMWTISFEFICYILVMTLGLLGFISNKKYWFVISLSIAILFLYSKVGNGSDFFGSGITYLEHKLHINHPLLKNPLIRLATFFFIGGCYYLFKDQLKISVKAYFGLCLLVIFGLFSSTLSEVILAVAGGAILFFFAHLNISSIKAFQSLPDVSYGVYLYAWPIQKLLIFYVPEISPWIVFIFTTCACVILGWLSWILIEKPFLKLKNISLIPIRLNL